MHSAAPVATNPGTITNSSCTDLTFTVAGAQPGDAVAPAIPTTDSLLSLGHQWSASTGSVTDRICNRTGSTYGGYTGSVKWSVYTFRP